MSKATKQSITLIHAMAAGFHRLFEKKFFARVDVHELCGAGYTMSVDMAKIWLKLGHEGDFEYAVETTHRWNDYVSAREGFFDARTYVYLISRILSDLSDKVRNPLKCKTLREMKEVVALLEEFTDPEGANFLASEEGDKALDSLYELIEWRW